MPDLGEQSQILICLLISCLTILVVSSPTRMLLGDENSGTLFYGINMYYMRVIHRDQCRGHGKSVRGEGTVIQHAGQLLGGNLPLLIAIRPHLQLKPGDLAPLARKAPRNDVREGIVTVEQQPLPHHVMGVLPMEVGVSRSGLSRDRLNDRFSTGDWGGCGRPGDRGSQRTGIDSSIRLFVTGKPSGTLAWQR